jgi:hypothetical protein
MNDTQNKFTTFKRQQAISYLTHITKSAYIPSLRKFTEKNRGLTAELFAFSSQHSTISLKISQKTEC